MSATELRQAAAACLLGLLCAPAGAADLSDSQAKTFFNANGCNACHGVVETRIGPPFVAVAARYAQTPDAAETLRRKIRAGGAGAWGLVPMISYPNLSDEQIQAVVRWILNAKTPAPDSGRSP